MKTVENAVKCDRTKRSWPKITLNRDFSPSCCLKTGAFTKNIYFGIWSLIVEFLGPEVVLGGGDDIESIDTCISSDRNLST